MAHYSAPGACVACHMGSNDNHRFDAMVANCQPCHAGAEDFDIGDTQTEVQAMLDELEVLLLGAGMITDTGAAVPGTYTEAKAAALWNWRDISIEDKSLGVHNPAYVKGLLEAGLAAF